jgi:hypothetical protein
MWRYVILASSALCLTVSAQAEVLNRNFAKRRIDLEAPPPHYGVTTYFCGDGLGAQYYRILFAMCYAELAGLDFRYSPFQACAHNYNGQDGYLEKKEWVVNLRHLFRLPEEGRPMIRLTDHNVIRFFGDRMAKVETSRALALIRRQFYANKRKEEFLDPNGFHIAVHIRRPNPHDDRIRGSDVPDAIFRQNVELLRERYAARRPLIHLFSQGEEAEFATLFPEPDIRLHINEDVDTTFCTMAFADVLCTSPSALSYMAGMLSQGDVYYQPYPYGNPLPSWNWAVYQPADPWPGLPRLPPAQCSDRPLGATPHPWSMR